MKPRKVRLPIRRVSAGFCKAFGLTLRELNNYLLLIIIIISLNDEESLNLQSAAAFLAWQSGSV